MRCVKIIVLFAILVPGYTSSQAIEPLQLTREMYSKTKQIRTMTYVMATRQRIKGKLTSEKAFFKLQYSPFKLYLKQEIPNNGLQGLYVEGTNENRILINPNGFPWMNLNLDPYGTLMLDGHHHPIFHSGFRHFVSVLEHLSTKYSSTLSTMISYQGTTKINGRDCYHLVLDNPKFKYVEYTVKEGETVLSIAKKLKINYYMIIENNNSISGIDKAKAGQVIRVPNDYASKLELWIDKEMMVPVQFKVFDDKGLFEEFTFTNVVINPVFKPEEFTPGYKDYKF
jgi:hypothetical protein